MEQGKIDSKQAILLMMSTVLPTAILTVPAVTVKFAQQDAWLSLLVALSVALIIALLIVNLGLRFPGKTLFVYPEEILGKIVGKIICGLYIGYFLQLGSAVVREFSLFLGATIMPNTPIVVFTILIIAVAAYAVRNGLEVLSRFNQLFIPLSGLLVIMFLLSSKEMNLTRVLPIFDTGLVPVLKGAAYPLNWLGLIVTMGVMLPYLNKPRRAYRVAVIATLLNGLFLLASIMGALLLFGPHLTANWLYPTYDAVRVICLDHVVERFESIILVMWLLGGFVKLGVFYYGAVLGSAQWFVLEDYRPLVIPVGVILGALSFLLYGENVADLDHFFTDAGIPSSVLIFEIGIPLALLSVDLLRGKGRRKG
ncbi:spore germination protein YndE [Peptococcaceae bacterium CEB3]|nr:spore germination protein YndE [Peptococcaceae bacterium CEB3]